MSTSGGCKKLSNWYEWSSTIFNFRLVYLPKNSIKPKQTGSKTKYASSRIKYHYQVLVYCYIQEIYNEQQWYKIQSILDENQNWLGWTNADDPVSIKPK